MRVSSSKKIMMVNRISQKSHTKQQHSSIQMSYQSVSTLSTIFNLTTYIYENISNCHTCYQKDGPMIINENISANSNFKLIFMYLIPVLILLFIFIVVSVILSILYWKSKTISRTNVSDVSTYHTIRHEEFEREIMSTHTTNETDINCSPYEVIIDDSDDLESIACKTIDTHCVTNHQQPFESPHSDLISKENVDSEGYQCPVSIDINASYSQVLVVSPFFESLDPASLSLIFYLCFQIFFQLYRRLKNQGSSVKH